MATLTAHCRMEMQSSGNRVRSARCNTRIRLSSPGLLANCTHTVLCCVAESKRFASACVLLTTRMAAQRHEMSVMLTCPPLPCLRRLSGVCIGTWRHLRRGTRRHKNTGGSFGRSSACCDLHMVSAPPARTPAPPSTHARPIMGRALPPGPEPRASALLMAHRSVAAFEAAAASSFSPRMAAPHCFPQPRRFPQPHCSGYALWRTLSIRIYPLPHLRLYCLAQIPPAISPARLI